MDLPLQLLYSRNFVYNSTFESFCRLKPVAPLCVCPVQPTCGPDTIARLIFSPHAQYPVDPSPQSSCAMLHYPRRNYSAQLLGAISFPNGRHRHFASRANGSTAPARRLACRACLPLLPSTPALPWTQSARATPLPLPHVHRP